jgi:hypothetical protein
MLCTLLVAAYIHAYTHYALIDVAGHGDEVTNETAYYNELKEELKTQKHIQAQQRAKDRVEDRERAGIAATANAAAKTLDAATTKDADVKHFEDGHTDHDSYHDNDGVHKAAKANAAAEAFIAAHDANHNGHEYLERDHGKHRVPFTRIHTATAVDSALVVLNYTCQ